MEPRPASSVNRGYFHITNHHGGSGSLVPGVLGGNAGKIVLRIS